MGLLHKLRGAGAPLPPRPPLRPILLAWLGVFLAITAVGLLKLSLAQEFVLGSFGATCVLAFGFPDVPFSQPRNIVLGHTLSSACGLAFLSVCGNTWWAMAAAVGTAIALMMATGTVHPPAGSNPVIVFLIQPGWAFLWMPTLAGALVVTLVALFYNNAVREGPYPRYW
ncbi:MAG: HPP family protein [Prochlorococcaceae cyanobacterium]|jgi:CBS-domain-containing membrane protein